MLGDTSIASSLGKKGTTTDISIYDRKTSDSIFSFCYPNTYPDKLQPLLQSIAISDYCILNVSKLDLSLGEQIIALDIFGIDKGFILFNYDIDIEKLKSIIKNTSIESFEIIDDLEKLKIRLMDFKSAYQPSNETTNPDKNNVLIPIDHVFDVKGVGTVILGSIRMGEIKTYDELSVNPLGKTVVIKSIQMHDDPVSSSKAPARVGLSIKGVSAKDLTRGDILSSEGLINVATTQFRLNFNKNKYFKEDIVESQNYMISVGLQIRTVKVKKDSENQLTISLEKPIAFIDNDLCILFKPDSKNMRIVGHGLIKSK